MTKFHRFTDLLAALLSRTRPITFAELAREVPEYAAGLNAADSLEPAKRDTATASLMRSFERDKSELRAMGVPIDTVTHPERNDSSTYRLDRKQFYLPYLSLLGVDGARSSPRKVDQHGYRALSTLTLGADELTSIVEGAATVRGLGDPLLAANIDSALRKLAVDLPLDAISSAGEPVVMQPRTRPANAVFETLSGALQRRKTVTFSYHALSTDSSESREVEPYGLFFLNSHWYLVANDRVRGELRNFRLNRISSAAANAKRAQSTDYDIPPAFRLREHAASRHAWELGDSDAVPVVVEVREGTGPALAAASLGAMVDDNPAHRAFNVKRADTFVRWMLSSAGALRPVAPSPLVAEYNQQVKNLGLLYLQETMPAASTPSVRQSAATRDSSPWEPKGAVAQLTRLLHLIPAMADGESHDVGELAAGLGTDASTLLRDLYSVGERYDLPGGFVEGVQLMVESGRVSATTNHFRRPMRLNAGEVAALALGLSVLRTRRTPADHAVIESARAKLDEIAVELSDDPISPSVHAASLGDHGDPQIFGAVRESIREHHKARISYRKSGASAVDERIVCPYLLTAQNGAFYLVAHCEREQGIRIFRLDRMESIELLRDGFEPAVVDLDELLQDGRMFQRRESDMMTVRYSPRITRWIAEREGYLPDADGGLVLEHPLADTEWAMRHVLQYGPDAEILAPASMRTLMRERVGQMLEDRAVTYDVPV